MPVTVDVDVIGAEMRLTQDLDGMIQRLRVAFDTTRARAADVSPAFRQFQTTWWDNERLIFDAQGIPSWPSLSPAYAMRKARTHPGKPMLRATDRLYASLTGQTADSIYTVEARSLQMGTNVPYSVYHTAGTRKMPARRHVHLLPEYWKKLNGMVFEYVVDPFRREER
jgi:phage gpG-like protein